MASRLVPHSDTSVIVRFVLRNANTGAGLTGLAFNSSGLIIGTICDVEATATAYTAAGSTIETITTLGTYAAPTATKCRFKEVDSTNHPGLYEFQFANARFSVTGAQQLVITALGATNLEQTTYEIQLLEGGLSAEDVADAVYDEALSDHTAAGSGGEAIHRMANKDGRLRSR